VFEGGDGFGLEFRRKEVRDEGFEEGHVVAGSFKGKVGLGADDEMGGFEMGKGGYDLGCVECWVKWCLDSSVLEESSSVYSTNQDCTQFEECVCGLFSCESQLAQSECYCHTMANSMLFPRLTATRSPFLTPMS
jgi:hypothetical protein